MHSTEEILQFLSSTIVAMSDVVNDPSEVRPSSLLDEDLGLDSLDFVDLQKRVFKAYQVRVTRAPFAAGQPRTVGVLAAHVRELLLAAAAEGGCQARLGTA